MSRPDPDQLGKQEPERIGLILPSSNIPIESELQRLLYRHSAPRLRSTPAGRARVACPQTS